MSDFTIKSGDALDIMSTLGASSVDALVTDPPYCSGAVGEAQRTSAKVQGLRRDTRHAWFVGDNMGTAGLVFLLRSIAFEAVRVVKPSGSVIVFCDWRQFGNIAPAIESAGLRFQNLIVWDKGSMGLGQGFRCQHELALHFTNGAPEYHAADVANVVRSSRVPTDDRQHPAQKPVDLLMSIIRVVAPEGGTVLDPFAGSASTGVACLRLRRRFLGIERDPMHALRGIHRLEAEALGLDLGAAEAGQSPLFEGGL